MRCHRYSFSSIILFACCFLLFGDDRAHAYIDPGTGSYLLQFAIGALFAGAFAIKAFWGKLKLSLLRALRQTEDGRRE